MVEGEAVGCRRGGRRVARVILKDWVREVVAVRKRVSKVLRARPVVRAAV